MANSIELRYRRPTVKEIGHTQVLLNRNPIGYFLPYIGLGKNQKYHLTLDELKKGYVAEYFPSRKAVIEFLGKKFGSKEKPCLLLDGVKKHGR